MGNVDQNPTLLLSLSSLLVDPHALTAHAGERRMITLSTIDALQARSKELTEPGKRAREALRTLDRLRLMGNLADGVPVSEGGVIQVLASRLDLISIARKQLAEGESVQIVSEDSAERIKASVEGIKSIDSAQLSPLQSVNAHEGPYTLVLDMDASWQALWDQEKSSFEMSELESLIDLSSLKSLIHDQDHPTVHVFWRDSKGHRLPQVGVLASHHSRSQLQLIKTQTAWGVSPLNGEQSLALHALLNPSIELVAIRGRAGTGKTLLALAAGLAQVSDIELYERVLVSRAIFPVGRDLGYLPGTLEEKMEPWLQPIYDNLECIMRSRQHSRGSARQRVRAEELLDLGFIEVAPITYIRGRSIPRQYLLIDEAQNLTPHEIKTILTRAGTGTKVVLLGDPEQVDHPYLDTRHNGLSYLCERFAGQRRFADCVLKQGERSDLAAIAAELL